MRYRVLLVLITILTLWVTYSYAQPSDDHDDIPDVSGEWVGIIEWHYTSGESAAPGDVQIYRLNMLQTDEQLKATHVTDGEDVLYTQPVDRYDEVPDWGFDGDLDGTTLEFNAVSFFMGHCQMQIILHYAEVDDNAVLSGHWTLDLPQLPPPPTLENTPEPDAPQPPDVVVGCGAPRGGAIVLRRFDLPNGDTDG